MGWVMLEILVALAVAVAIVWWTMPRRPKDGEAARRKETGGKEVP